jgi:hypothetical protein
VRAVPGGLRGPGNPPGIRSQEICGAPGARFPWMLAIAAFLLVLPALGRPRRRSKAEAVPAAENRVEGC